jgi:formylmethanofuran dehydrogenase subunit C
MSGLVLTLRQRPRQRLDMSPLSPPRLRDMTAREIAAIELLLDNRAVACGELFDIAAGDPRQLRIAGSCDRLDCIGRHLRDGAIEIEGDAGACLGLDMAGGRIAVGGNAGNYAGAGMTGGRIDIAGDAGDRLGGALPGERFGLNGGRVVVRGHAGHRLGDRMRRGLILVEGDVGDFAASRLIAGTIVALGERVGRYPGFAMKRGTLATRRRSPELLPGFADSGTQDQGFLRLMLRDLARDLPDIETRLPPSARVHRYAGDLAANGQGELLIWE